MTVDEILVRLAQLVMDTEDLWLVVELNANPAATHELVTVYWESRRSLKSALGNLRRCAAILRDGSLPGTVDEEA